MQILFWVISFIIFFVAGIVYLYDLIVTDTKMNERIKKINR